MVSERYSVSEIAYMPCELINADPRMETRSFFRKRLLPETPYYSAFVNTEFPPAMSKLMYITSIPFHLMYGEDDYSTTYEEYEEAKERKEKIDNLILKGKSP
jgi:hypothetical protein